MDLPWLTSAFDRQFNDSVRVNRDSLNAAYQPRCAVRAIGCMRLFGGLPAGVGNRLSGSNLDGCVEVDLS